MEFEPGIILAITMLCFILTFALEVVLITLLLKSSMVGKDVGGPGQLNEQRDKHLEEAHARALAEPVASVTEHTTRSFDPVYSERK